MAATTVTRIGVRSGRRAGSEIVFDDSQDEPPLRYGRWVYELRTEAERLHDEKMIREFPGPFESVKAVTLTRRGENEATGR